MTLLIGVLTLSVNLAVGADLKADSHIREPIEIQGVATGFRNLKKDGQVDLAMIFPALTWQDVIQIEASMMMSPYPDELKVVTERMNIPSNVSLPEQKERHIIPITIKKPTYRLFLPNPGLYRLTAAHGQFPLKPVIKALKDGKSFFDVLNYSQFFSAGQIDLDIQSNLNTVDIPINQISFTENVTVTAPNFSKPLVMVTMPMVDQGDGYYFPSDIKQLKPGETLKLRVPGADSRKIVTSLLLSQEEVDKIDRMYFAGFRQQLQDSSFFESLNPSNGGGGFSVAIQEEKSVVTTHFLPLVARPKLVARTMRAGQDLLLDVPVAPSHIEPMGVYFIISEIETIPNGAIGAERRHRLWEGFEPVWHDRYAIPSSVPALEPGKKYRWDVLFLGREAGQHRDPDGYFLDDVTHVTRNSVDF